MGNPVLAPVEASKHKAEPARLPAMRPHGLPPIHSIPNFLSSAGNMAIQRAASGPLGNKAAGILGGASMSGGGCSCGGTCEECSKKPVQRKAQADAAMPSSGFHSALNRSGPGTPLPSHTRGLMESRFGETFDDVRIHDDGAAADAAHAIQAHAFTTGRNIYFGQGQYQPHSTGGQKLLAHELTHVLQQRRGVVQPGLKSLNASANNDVFEREAEQVEAHVGKEKHGLPADVSGIGRHDHHLASGNTSLQRKCACGGTCSKCSGATSPPITPELTKNPLQRKAEGNLESHPRTPKRQRDNSEHHKEGAEQSALAEKKIQRKCACGGTCSKCSSESSGIAQSEWKKPSIQRKPEDAPDSKAKPSPEQQIDSAPDRKIQRKCACGGTCSKCSGAQEELKTSVMQRKPETAVDPVREKPVAARENKLMTERGGRKEATRGERNPGLQSGVTAQPRTRTSRPASSGRKTLSAIQRSPSASSAKGASNPRNDSFEREADAAANDVMHGRQVSSDKLSAADDQSIQKVDWQFCVPYIDPDCTVSSTADVVSSETEEIASDVWEGAKKLASAVGGVLKKLNNLLTITIPPKHICDAHAIQLPLPEIGKNIPFLEGAVPIAEGVEIYGEVGLHLGVIPEIGLQVGPCETHEITIALHPLTLSGDAKGGFDLTVAGDLGGEARASIYGEVGVMILWPDPPLLIQIPVANIQAGLAGFVRGIIADHMSVDFDVSADMTGFTFDFSRHDDLGFAIDLGLAGFGALTLLGQNICTLYYPLFETHKQTVLSLGFGYGMEMTDSSASLDIRGEEPEFDTVKWDDLGIEFRRDMFKQDCPLCDLLRALHLMPSDFGGTWKGPGPLWPMGPLHPVYYRNPHLRSDALCRGACGPDCKTCKEEKEHRVCVDAGNGCHEWWVYPKYDICDTHSGCRNHDGCYDWCSDKTGFRGKGIYISPCHRWCDFECICDYNLPQCIGWIGGKPPYDGQLVFSDMPYKEPGCTGPCPTAGKTPGAAGAMKLCLPPFDIVGRRTVFHKAFRHNTGDLVIFSTPLEIPYIPPMILDVFVRGELRASADAGLGPVTLEGVCLIFDPATHAYSGTGSVHLKGDLHGALTLAGILGAKAGWGCLLNAIDLEVIRGEAGLSATALADLPLDLSATATVSCRHGKLMLDVDTLFTACLDLIFKLEASLKVLLFKRFEIFSGKWELLKRRWGHCWNIPLGVTKGEIASASCGGSGAAAAVLGGLAGGAAAGAAPGAGPGAAPLAAPSAPGTGLSHVELGSVDTLSIKGLLTDLFKLADQSEVIHDKKHGGLPADPAKDAGKENPCGEVKPDDECGSKKLPLTHVSFFPGPLGQGGRVKASPLSKCPGNTEGSEPDNSIYKAQFDCINAAGQGGFWVRAHILHGKTSSSGSRNLHGPGDDVRNLIITDKSLNGTMNTGAEKPVLTRVYDNSEVLWYDSTVDSYVPGLDFFAQSITVRFGSFDTSTGTEGPELPGSGGTFTLKRTPPNCPAGSGGLVVPPGVLGGATDECADPLDIPQFDTPVDGKTRTVKMKDVKHTRMAKKPLDRILEVAKQAPSCKDPALSACEQEFCKAVASTDKKKFGGQIDSATRVADVYKQLLVDAWKGKKVPSSGEWTEFGSAGDDVGFDMDSKAATTEYTVHTNVTTGGKLFTGTHLFPGEGD